MENEKVRSIPHSAIAPLAVSGKFLILFQFVMLLKFYKEQVVNMEFNWLTLKSECWIYMLTNDWNPEMLYLWLI